MKVILVVLVAFAVLCASAADVKDLDFALRYRGTCTHSSNSETSTCKLKAQSQEVLTRIKATGGVEFHIKDLIGSISYMDLDVTYNFTSLTFSSKGSTTFGVHNTHQNHRLDFSDNGAGKIGYTPASAYGFATTWKVTRGYGAFNQAAGFITFNGVWSFDKNEAIGGVVGVIHMPGDNSTLAI